MTFHRLLTDLPMYGWRQKPASAGLELIATVWARDSWVFYLHLPVCVQTVKPSIKRMSLLHLAWPSPNYVTYWAYDIDKDHILAARLKFSLNIFPFDYSIEMTKFDIHHQIYFSRFQRFDCVYDVLFNKNVRWENTHTCDEGVS